MFEKIKFRYLMWQYKRYERKANNWKKICEQLKEQLKEQKND